MSSNNWFIMWILLELNTFAFLTIMSSKSLLVSNNNMITYFVIQTIASILFIFAMMGSETYINSKNMMLEKSSLIILILAMLIKLGVPPFHSWMIKLTPLISNQTLLLLLTWQKLMPLILISQLTMTIFLYLVIFLSAILATFSQFFISHLLLLLTMSSIFHMSWMLSSSYFKDALIFLYLLVYSLLLLQLFMMIKHSNYKTFSFQENLKLLVIFNLTLMSMAGIPPLLGFFPKWFIVMEAFYALSHQVMIILLLLLASANFFIYLRMAYSTLTLPSPPSKKLKKFFNSKYFFMFNLLLPVMILSY